MGETSWSLILFDVLVAVFFASPPEEKKNLVERIAFSVQPSVDFPRMVDRRQVREREGYMITVY